MVAVSALVIFLAVRPSGNTSDDLRWSAFPHTMGCVTDPPNLSVPQDPSAPVVPLTDAVRVEQVSLTHPGGQRVELSIEFPDMAPPVPETIFSPDTGRVEDVPGSISYHVLLVPGPGADPKSGGPLTLYSPTGGAPWKAHTSKLDHPERNTLISVEVTGNVITFLLDLDGQRKWLGDGRFTPFVLVNAHRQGLPNGLPDIVFYYGQRCFWDTPITPDSGQNSGQRSDSPSPAQIPPPLPAPTAQPTANPPNSLNIAFITDAKNDGVTTRDGNDQMIGNLGQGICGLMYRGYTAAGIAGQIQNYNPNNDSALNWVNDLNPVTYQQASDMVRYAYNDICPGATGVGPYYRGGKTPWQ